MQLTLHLTGCEFNAVDLIILIINQSSIAHF